MLNVSDLDYTLDSLSQQNDKQFEEFSTRMYQRTITPSINKVGNNISKKRS